MRKYILAYQYIVVMGGCIVSEPKEVRAEPVYSSPTKQGNSLLYESSAQGTPITSNKPSMVSTITNEESVRTLEDRLQESQENLQDWTEQHTNSVIIKLSNRRRQRSGSSSPEKQDALSSSPQKGAGFLSRLEDNPDDIQGSILEDPKYSKVWLKNKLMDIEFTLPKSRAGPLVVPYIAYDNYLLSTS